MKVLLDLQYLNVATTGIKTYMMELAKASQAFPHPAIEWIFTHDPEVQAADTTFKNPKSKIQRLNYHLDYFRWKEFQLPDFVKKINPDVLICPDFVSPAASLSCRRLTVIHDAFFWQMPQNYPLWWRTYFLSLIRKGLKEQTEIITTSNYAKESILTHLKPKFPISVIYQSPKAFTIGSDNGFLNHLGVSPKSYFLHIGTFDRRKNLLLLVKAYQQFLKETGSKKKLILPGGSGQSKEMDDLPRIKDLIKKSGLEKQVILTGYISDNQVKALYKDAFAYIFPSENEGFGIPIIEAMGYGLPVIHSDQPALTEVSGGAGLAAKSGNIPDLARKMVLLDQNKNVQEDLIAKGLKRSQDFSPEKFIQAFYNQILTI